MNNIKNKKILLIICGGISAYKSLEIIRLLKKQGATVKTILTKSAKEFITPLSVASLSQEKVYYDLFGFNIDPAFKTDDDYPPRGKYLSLRDKTLSNDEQAKRKQFCIDLFDFSNERIQSKTSGVPSKDKRFMLFELYKVFQTLCPFQNY